MTLIEKVTEYAAGYGMFDGCGVLLCCVSGGADSVCLLHLLHSLSSRLGFSVIAAHFNHMLRGAESDRDEAFVGGLCRSLKVELLSGRGDVAAYAASNKLGIEEAARKLRYGFFEETAEALRARGYSGVRAATAHNADDNAETVLFNLVRGAGLGGLSGIPPVRGIYVRPLLTVSRAEIEDYLAVNGLEHIEDSSNSDTSYARNRIRRDVMPVLKSINPSFAAAAARAAELLRRDNEYMVSEADKLISYEAGVCVMSVSSLRQAASPIASRALTLAAKNLGASLTASNVADLEKLICSENPSAAVSLPGGIWAVRSYGSLELQKGPPEAASFEPRELLFNRWTRLDSPCGSAFEIYYGDAAMAELELDKIKTGGIDGLFNIFYFQKDKIYGNIIARPRKTGDAIALKRAAGSAACRKTLKKFFIELKIPRYKRENIPVFADSEGIIAVYGIGQDIRAAADSPGVGDKADNLAVLIIAERKRDA